MQIISDPAGSGSTTLPSSRRDSHWDYLHSVVGSGDKKIKWCDQRQIFKCIGPCVVELSGLWTLLQRWGCMCVEREWTPCARLCTPPFPLRGSSVEEHETWRKPRNGQLLHIWDILLQGPVTSRVRIFFLSYWEQMLPNPILIFLHVFDYSTIWFTLCTYM
jgi:hypothetical protein